MDELVEYLYINKPDNIIIGEDDCNLLIFGDGTSTPTIVKMLVLVVGCCDSITDKTIDELRKKYLSSAKFKRLYAAGKKMATIAKIPFIMIGYKKCNNPIIDDEYLEKMQFMARIICPSNEKEKPKIFESNDFVKYLYALMEINYKDTGTNKQKNKSLADIFHIWSRSKLSSQLVKQDFDAIYLDDDQFTMIEVKRSPSKTIESWAPYKADCRNYDLLNQFAKVLNSAFFTFHHNGGKCVNTTKVGCYEVINVNIDENERWIDYNKSMINAEQIFDLLESKY